MGSAGSRRVEGSDELIGGSGDDYFDGGVGFDVVSYAGAGVTIDLPLGGTKNPDGAGNDQLIGIEAWSA